MYPKITVNWTRLQQNIITLKQRCQEAGVDTMLVTKLVSAHLPLIEKMDHLGLSYFADSRIQNLKKLASLQTPKFLLRIPMISELPQVLEYAQGSLQSEWDTLLALEQLAKEKNIHHKVLLMMDLGDLREGSFLEEELEELVQKVLELQHITLLGLGTNLSCYGAIRPTKTNLGRLVDIAQALRQTYNIPLPVISGGSTNAIYLLEKGELPQGINNLRIGEGYFLGTEPSFGKTLENMDQEVFTLHGEIVEIKDKPSIPIGERGFAAFRTSPAFEDRGIRRRAIIAVGKQDIELVALFPKDKDCHILGASSDHLIVDITDSQKTYAVGNILKFQVGYAAILRGFTSEYVTKEIIE